MAPFEIPVAYTRRGSMPTSRPRVSMSARTKPTSSCAAVVNPRPSFHEREGDGAQRSQEAWHAPI